MKRSSAVAATDAIWVTWEPQVRNRSISTVLGVPLYLHRYSGNRLVRYLVCAVKTVSTVIKARPNVVFAPCPSIILAALLILLRRVFRFKTVIDAHHAGIVAFNGSRLIQKTLDFCNSRADLVIVTNCEHAKHVARLGGKAVISEDPLPEIAQYHTESDPAEKAILFICSFDYDEPYHTVFRAAESLAKEGFLLRVSGNYRKAGINENDYPSVTFLGFLPEEEYYACLFRSSVILDLTESENCLVCGAYEAMAAERPLVTSDTACLRSHFSQGVIYTKHDEVSICNAVRDAYRDGDLLRRGIKLWKEQKEKLQRERIDGICSALGMSGECHGHDTP